MSRLTCEQAMREFFAYLDRALSGEAVDDMELHLEECLSCCDRLALTRQLDVFVKARLLESDAPAGLEQRIRERLALVDFHMRIGVNSGPVVVGKIGDDLRSDYTALGDTTNVAARMLTLAKPGAIAVSENSYRLVQSYFTFSSLGQVRVKGRQKPVHAYQVTGLGRVRTRMQAGISQGLTPFVGREREMAVLTEAFERGAAGSGQVVMIRGEAGIGKSRLVHEFVKSLAGLPMLSFQTACAPFSQAFPYYPFIDIVCDYCEIGDDDDESRIREKARRK